VIAVNDHPLGATFPVRVHPRAGSTAITGTMGDALKVSLSAPPVEGKANVALTEFFAEVFCVPRASVQVVGGERARNKLIRVVGRSAAELQQRLREHFTV
jgi:uncharacterized protein (TIGR00251 family)